MSGFTIFFLTCIFCFSLHAQGVDIDARKSAFIDRLVESGNYDRAYLDLMMDQIEIKQTILDAISRPAERVLTWNDYRNIFVTEQRINEGLTFFNEHKALLKDVSDAYGVPIEIILSILAV